MRARALDGFRCYHHYALVDVKAGEVVDGDLAAYLLGTGAPVEQVDDESAARPARTRSKAKD